MRYTEVDFLVAPVEPWRDLLMVELMELGYEGFEETSHGLKGYVPTAEFERSALDRLMVARDPHVSVSHTVREVPEVNWNARWEQEFQPVEVDGKVRIRAEFHPVVAGYEHDLVITPRMAFGTGHHATTRMMVRSMMGMDLTGQRVCDLGCGTGVLAILAERLGATEIIAIDNDPTAVTNARENVEMNKCTRITVEKDGTDLESGAEYDTILANIERNTLVHAMPYLVGALAEGGNLLLSGFVIADEAIMAQAAKQAGLTNVQQLHDGEWAFSRWVRTITQHAA
ncbi:MAG: 50S ribosomal protein L11 methyltransferase [Flavobacteriales bacterium]|nr:50S ribosomal protein L11 methyltransferase [Flavobacteriales bacterium]